MRANRDWLAPVLLALILAAGSYLRIERSSTFTGLGFDEALYRNYADQLARVGPLYFPEIVQLYLEEQSKLPEAILPPTRFVYIACGAAVHRLTGLGTLDALHVVSCGFSVLALGLAALFAWRMGGRWMGVGVAALVAVAPTQIHMSQHALIDGVFAFWALLCLWLLWENLAHPDSLPRLAAYAGALALLVMTKENSFFVAVALCAVLGVAWWAPVGRATRGLLLATFLGPLAGVSALVLLCGGADVFFHVYLLLVEKAYNLRYAIMTGDGPWHRYLVELMLVSPAVLVLALGSLPQIRRSDRAPLYLLGFLVASYAVMANVKYGMNLRYTNMWDMPLRFLALWTLRGWAARFPRGPLLAAAAVVAICAAELYQYRTLFARTGMYETVPAALMYGTKMLKVFPSQP